MKNILLDIETFSSVDLRKTGVYRYVEAEDFEILLLSYSIDGGAIQTVDLASGEKLPDEITLAFLSDEVIKWAFNAQFERVCISEWLKRNGYDLERPVSFGEEREFLRYLDPVSWRCDMVWSAYLGLPLSLEQVGNVLNLDKKKLKEGKDLIRYFSLPCRPTISNKQRTRNLPRHDPEKWAEFKAYNKRDVETEMLIHEKLSRFPVPEFEGELYIRDQQINDLGILIDKELAANAIRMNESVREEYLVRLKNITSLENPNSVVQLKEWLTSKGIVTESLDKKAVRELLGEATGEVKEVLETRQELSKSSIKKYEAMRDCVCKDGRARGLLQFYGANRTGRFSGRLIQVQNLPRNNMDDLELARTLVKQNDLASLELLFDSVPQVLSELIRTAFIPKEGRVFLVADYSAIEARVLAWLAGEKWRVELFQKGGDIYCQSASEMFGVPVEKNGINGHLRQKGKIAELACGYGGSVGALKSMGALEMGLLEEELPGLVDSWRMSNPQITKLWRDVDTAAMTTVRERRKTKVKYISFEYKSGMLILTLPSKRQLFYVKPRITENRFGGESISYMGVGTGRRWERLETYGAKLVENIVQAISRDILCSALMTFKYSDIVMHVHDEIVIEADPRMSVEAVCKQMSRTPEWANGLLLDADGFTCDFYQKD
ncbi:MAG: DNA polymerase [Candidatus Cloacimonadaceae bacterium]|jgi:DNA polymerase